MRPAGGRHVGNGIHRAGMLPAFSPIELAIGRYIAYGAIALGLILPRIAG